MHKFSHHHAERLERPERYALLPPRETLLLFGLKEGMSFADIGAGTGFFSRAASEIVGAMGKVHAIDMSPEILEYLRTISPAHVIQTVHSGEYSVPLPDGVADLTLLAFVVHETPDISRFIAEALRITRRGGTVVILEWKKQNEEHGPEKEERLDMQDLLVHLSEKPVTFGELNVSHYFVRIQR
jgi:ubiquinone/menaquinone biosynthesis C-methylase UbiE